MAKFLRRNSDRHSKLGRKRKKKQTWRRPTGRHNKMRDKKRGYPAVVSIGYRKNRKKRGKLNGMKPVLIMNIEDIKKIKKDEIGVVGGVGLKKKIEIIKKAKGDKILLYNINIEKFLNKNQIEEKIKNERPSVAVQGKKK